VVLSGGLSNHSFGDLVHCLTHQSSDQELQRRHAQRTGWPDGRRKFGEVSGAIKAVLATDGGVMRMKEIHAEVERLLGGDVSFQSVADYLIKGSKGQRPLFVRTRYGHYRLQRTSET
jgi:hypothetical protein